MNEDEINLGSLLDSLWLDRKLVGLIAAAIFVLGTGYAFLAKPVYEANLIVQVEDSPGSTKSLLGERFPVRHQDGRICGNGNIAHTQGGRKCGR